ncbi:pilus assembly protein [Rhodopirellula sp. JC740]|uniref:Pilus assembly protein n=1 Tax=Rhodopirellula halodulae TaxID=2894198 RepID=A0ABS8NI09_9BACT|nr:TadE family protein [Rhodopirellula sp. JC740]MCC9643205.1 pilus assembly protein [Rhodopirellula sp. JC740]
MGNDSSSTDRLRASDARGCARDRSGQALIEFSLIALVLYLLVGGAITFGIWIHAAGQIQVAANVGARELSQTPLPIDCSFEEALRDPTVMRRIYDDRWLVIDLDELEQEIPNYNFFLDVVPQMPLLNQQLATLYIMDEFVERGSAEDCELPSENEITTTRRLLRYPGAMLERTEDEEGKPEIGLDYVADEFVVQIPLVIERQEGHNGGGGAERIRWVDVVEEIDTEDLPDDDSGSNPDPFMLDNTDENIRGVVALRVHYPAQSPWMSSFRDNGKFVPNIGDPNAAIDCEVESINPDAMRGTLLCRPLIEFNSDGERIYAGTYGGKYGLGVHGALTSQELTGSAIGIRPYRRTLVSHAIFRREVLSPEKPETPSP